MAKKFIFFSVIVATFIALACYAGFQNTSTETVSFISSDDGMVYENTAIVHKDPPQQLIFFSKEELKAFLNARNLTDQDLQDFLDQNNYSMNGVSSRNELEGIAEMITSTPFPTVESLDPSDITVFTESKMLHVRYETPSGAVYSFKYSIQEMNTVSKKQSLTEQTHMDLTHIPINRSDLQLYKVDKSSLQSSYDSPDMYPYIIQSDRPVTLRMFNIDTTVIEDYVDNIVFENLLT